MSGTPRHLRDAQPKYALVLWPDNVDKQQPECIELSGLDSALKYGAILIGKEDAEWCKPRAPQPIDPGLLRVLRQHPYRRFADWRPDDEEYR